MRIRFKAQHPKFGTRNKPLSQSHIEQSPYYWWWEFLRRNEQYAECCAKGGEGAYKKVYQHFGDVFHDTFKAWWTQKGFHLFGEKQLEITMAELNSPAEWNVDWNKNNVMVVVVPLNLPKRAANKTFVQLLRKRHPGKRGRKSLGDSDASTALYRLHRNVSVHTLRIQLQVYDLVMAKKRGESKKTQAQIGAELGLLKSAKPDPKDTRIEAAHKRMVMSATVNRHFKFAKRIIENTFKGQFPNSEP